MGCEELRQSPPEEPPISPYILYEVSDIESELSILSEFTSNFSLYNHSNSQTISEISRLIHDTDWISHLESKQISIKTKENSAINEYTPVSLVILNLEEQIPAWKIIDLLLDPEKRVQWDPTIVSLEIGGEKENETTRIRIVRKYPFINRLLDLELSHIVEDDFYEVVFEDSEVEEEDESMVKANCMLGMYKIVEKKQGTLFICMHQIDYKQPKLKEKSQLAACELVEWILYLKRALEKFINEDV